MTTLRPASAAKSTSDSALDDIQLAAVAAAINMASNTGQYEAIFQEPLRDNTKEQLEANGYTVKYVHNNAYNMEKHALIIWRDVKPGDLVPEPSNSGPKYNTKLESEEESEEAEG